MGLSSMQHSSQNQQPGPPPSQLLSSRPSSVVSQQHQSQAHPPPPPPQQQQPQTQHQQPPSAYSSSHSLPQAYSSGGQNTNSQDTISYYNHPSPYSTPGAHSGYNSADTSDMMAAAQLPRHPYPPMQYHTPQSNSPASVPSSSHHDQHRSIYGQPHSQHLHQPMYYQPSPYQSMPQHAPSPYAQHAQHPQQPMTSQPNMMMSHTAPQNQMAQHASPHAQAGMTESPRPKIEPQMPVQLQQKPQHQTSPMPQAHGTPNGSQLQSPGSHPGNLNNNAAPGPIPATTPLVVRQDGNGVQWIAFEYSRDRVKMEYTIRCDVESVDTEMLSPDFKQENCVYPRACCPRDQYRGNRLNYESECNRVGWALAQLNVSLRGKRGLIQRAVDSWRNSNQDPRLRSRRVRRMAKMNNRKQVAASPHGHPGAHMMPPAAGMPGPMGQGAAPSMAKPSLSSMGQLHPHHGGHPDGNAQSAGDEVGSAQSFDDQHHHQTSTPQPPHHGHPGGDVRQAQVFTGYGAHSYPPPVSATGGPMSQMASSTAGPVPARQRGRSQASDRDNLFPDLPDAKKRKFILVEDKARGSRLRVRVTLDGVDTNEIPDSFRKGSSVFPRTYFPREMQSPPPSATGSRFFEDDASDDGKQETEGRHASRRGAGVFATQDVKVPNGGSSRGDAKIPVTTRARRGREVRLNDLGYRMAWLQSRVFSERPVFLQRSLDCYRNKTRLAMETMMQDVQASAPHYETRIGKRRWSSLSKRDEKRTDE